MHTRSHKRALSSYRRHRRASHCHKKGRAVCRTANGCKFATGRKRSFCRKSHNKHRSGFRHKKQHGGATETLPYGAAGNLAFDAGKYIPLFAAEIQG